MKRCPECGASVPEHYTAEMLRVICLRFGPPETRNKLEEAIKLERTKQ